MSFKRKGNPYLVIRMGYEVSDVPPVQMGRMTFAVQPDRVAISITSSNGHIGVDISGLRILKTGRLSASRYGVPSASFRTAHELPWLAEIIADAGERAAEILEASNAQS